MSVGGGFTGLVQESSVDVQALDAPTREALLHYFNHALPAKPGNLNETWMLNDEKEVPVDSSKMNEALRQLYEKMKSDLGYPKH